MAGFLERISSAYHGESRDNETKAISMTDWSKMFRPGGVVNYNGLSYQAFSLGAYGTNNTGLYEKNSVVFACESKRINVFCEAGFKFQRFTKDGRPGELFGNQDLKILEEPWPGASMRDLLAVAELDVATAGNSYWVENGGYLQRLNPAEVTIVWEDVTDDLSGSTIGQRLLGYVHRNKSQTPTVYAPEEIAHYKPTPGCNPFVGQSWMTACFSDIDADDAMTEHKRKTVRNGANLRTVVSLDATISTEEFKKFVELFQDQHEGPENAGKTLFLGGGADVKAMQQTFEDLALKATQGATETRIAACAGVHPVVAGLSEGMQGSSLNAGNYSAAKRSFVDGTMRPLWGAFAQAFRWLVRVPSGARLWYDDRDIPFLREDIKDQAEIMHSDAGTINLLTIAGFKPDAIVDALKSRDIGKLTGQHTGLFSVQLMPPGNTAPGPNGQPTAVDAPPTDKKPPDKKALPAGQTPSKKAPVAPVKAPAKPSKGQG
jgi:hypothetical protein